MSWAWQQSGDSLFDVNEQLDNLLNDDTLTDITARSLPDLRSARVAAAPAENDVSLVRRISQGRLDIVGHELQRRAGKADGEADVPGLLFSLPEILSGDSGGGASGRAVVINEPGPIALSLVERLDKVVSPGDLSGVDKLDDGSLRMVFERIGDIEAELSGVRRQLHERIDAIQAEIGRRYRDGEVSIDSILK